MVKIIYCIVKVESRECEILKTAFKKDGDSHDVMSGGGGRRVNVTITLIFSQIVWVCPLSYSFVALLTTFAAL